MDKKHIKAKAIEYLEYTIANYRHLHQYPELSFEEKETSQFIQQELTKLEIPFKNNIGGEGILARIEGAQPGKVIALRTDMDALAILENTGLLWSSKNKGVMHACGHDAHMATLLTTAKILNELKGHLSGTILLVFQPGEERYPGGASLMLQDGLFDQWKPEVMLGHHVLPNMEAGKIGMRSGLCMASADEIYIEVSGKGGHAALPHVLNDTVLAASSIVVGLQQVISRRVPAHVPAVLSFGKFIANGATNVMPQKVQLSGTLRFMDEAWRAKAKIFITEAVKNIASANGCSCLVEIKHGYPCVYNDPEIYKKGKQFLSNYFGDEKVEEMEIRMTAEDFGFYSQLYPSLFYRFGITGKSNIKSGGLHTSNFTIDENAFLTSVGGMTWNALNFLEV